MADIIDIPDGNIIHDINIDLYKQDISEPVEAKQGDKNSGYIRATLWNNGSLYEVDTNSVITFCCTKPDGFGIDNIAGIDSGGRIVYEITEQTISKDGYFDAEFRIYGTKLVDGETVTTRLSTFNFKMNVTKTTLNDDTVISSNEFNVLTNLIATVGDLTSDVNEATANANTATINANTAAALANTNAGLADTAATNADTKAGLAQSAADNANTKAGLADTATINATNAATLANTKAGLADTAATNADTKAGLADTAATNANDIATQLETETLKIYKDAVTNYSDLATTYPSPENGWTVAVTGESISYRWNGTTWVNLGGLYGNPLASDVLYDNSTSGLTATNAQTAIDEVDTKLLETTGYGVISGLLVTSQDTPNMTVNVSSGSARMLNGKKSIVSNNSSLTVNASDSTNNRKDIIYLNSSGVVSYLVGTSLSIKSVRTYTVTTNFVVNDTMSINIAKFTATASTTNATNFAVGGTIADTVTNIVAALNANVTITDLYTVSTSGNTFTLTEKASGSGFTPSIAVFTGTGVVSNGTPTNSVNAVPPTTPTGCVLLAIVKVGVGVTSIQTSDITDKRIMVKSNTALAEETYIINNMLKDLSIGSIMNKIRKGLSVKIVCYGDSITRGYYTTTPWTTLLQNDLRWTFNNNNISVINSAIGGAFASDGANSNNFQTAVAEYIPDMCIIAYGMNDQISSLPVNDYKNNIVTMIRYCKQNNILACVMTPTPCFIEPYNKYGDSYALACIEACKKECVPYIDLYNGFYAAYKKHFMRPTDIADKVHPGDAGAHFIKNKIETDLFEYLYIKDTVDIPLSRTKYATTDLTNHYPDNNIFFGETVVLNKSGATGTFLKMNFFIDSASATVFLNALTYQNGGTYNVVMDGVSIPVNTTTGTLIPETYIQLGVVGYGMHTISVTNTDWVTGGEELHMISLRVQIVDEITSNILSRINGTALITDANSAIISGVYTIDPDTINTPVAAYGILTVKTGNSGTWLFHDIVTSAGIKYSRYNINNAGWSTWA